MQEVDLRLVVADEQTAENVLQSICDELPQLVQGGVVLSNDGFGNLVPREETRVTEHSEECDICGDNHDPEEHGVPFISLDTGRDTVEGFIKQKLNVCTVHYNGRRWQELQTLSESIELVPEDEALDQWVYLDDKIDEAVRAEGDIPFTDPDMGVWMVYEGMGVEV